MSRFVRVADVDGATNFVDLDKVSNVSFRVIGESAGRVTSVITLMTAAGAGHLYFNDLYEAKRWARIAFQIEIA